MLNLREFAFAVFNSLVKLNGYSALVSGDGFYDSSIAVENIFIVVVARLYDLIANTVRGAPIFDLDWQGLACLFSKICLSRRCVIWI